MSQISVFGQHLIVSESGSVFIPKTAAKCTSSCNSYFIRHKQFYFFLTLSHFCYEEQYSTQDKHL